MKQFLILSLTFFIDLLTFIPIRVLKLAIYYRQGNAIGEQICLTSIPSRVFQKYHRRSIIFTSIPTIFKQHPNIVKVINIEALPTLMKKIISLWVKNSKNSFIEEFLLNQKKGNLDIFMNNEGRHTRFSLTHIQSMHFKRSISGLPELPIITFSHDEQVQFKNKFKSLPTRFALVQSEGKTSFTENKNWCPKNFDNVVSQLQDIPFIQVGVSSEAKISCDFDLRGKTSLRELFYLTSKAAYVLSTEGIFNHLTAAFATPHFCIFSGFTHTELSKYKNTIAIKSEVSPECEPCWQREPCPIKGRPCIMNITPNQVIDVIQNTTI
jgi:hypothetical protein